MSFRTKTSTRRYVIGFSDTARKQVHPDELKNMFFPCVVYHLGYADNWTRLWGLKDDENGGWRQDYLIYAQMPKELRKTAEKPKKQEETVMANHSTNNREITDVFPISKSCGALAVRPTINDYEAAVIAAKLKSVSFGNVRLEHFRGTNKIVTEFYENGKMVERVDGKAIDAAQEKEEVVCRKTREKRFDKVLQKTKSKYVR